MTYLVILGLSAEPTRPPSRLLACPRQPEEPRLLWRPAKACQRLVSAGLSEVCFGGFLEAFLGHFVGTKIVQKPETFIKFLVFCETCLSVEREARYT